MRTRLLLLSFGLLIGLRAQSETAELRRPQEGPAELLRRVRAKIADSLNRLPKYMCTQTVDRSSYEPDTHARGVDACDEGVRRRPTHLSTSDRLRLDVAMTGSGEMYSWVGDNRFSDRELIEIVREGAISGGTFSGFLASIFDTNDASFTYNGDVTYDGLRLSDFGFRIPYDKSHYMFGQGSGKVVTGYEGTFLVDPNTSDLVRLIIRTDRLPAETSVCHAATTLDYSRVRFNDKDFLLPSASRLKILHLDGGYSENRAVFAACRAFLGESTISFDPTPENLTPSTRRPAPARSVEIPQGIPFRVALTHGIDTSTAAAGDALKAQLLTPIQSGENIIVPAGTFVSARIVRIRRFYGKDRGVALEIRLEDMDVQGVLTRMIAAPDLGARFRKGTGLKQRQELGMLRGVDERSNNFVFRNVSEPYLIGKGLESAWVTVAPARVQE